MGRWNRGGTVFLPSRMSRLEQMFVFSIVKLSDEAVLRCVRYSCDDSKFSVLGWSDIINV